MIAEELIKIFDGEKTIIAEELIKILKTVNPKAEIIIQKTTNEYSPLATVDKNCVYVPKNPLSGKIYDLNWDSSDADLSEENWNTVQTKPPCVLLIPNNISIDTLTF